MNIGWRRGDDENEPTRLLLRQRADGKLLGGAQKRADAAQTVPDVG